MSDTNIVEGFLNTFQILSKNEKAIWRYLQTFSKEYRNVFPSHERIAKSCKCHRSTVIRSIKKFKSFGFDDDNKTLFPFPVVTIGVGILLYFLFVLLQILINNIE